MTRRLVQLNAPTGPGHIVDNIYLDLGQKKSPKEKPRMFFNEDGRPENSKAARNLGLRYAQLLEKHQKNQQKLSRAFRAWEKTNAALKRAEKRLDKMQAAQEAEA